MIPSDRSHPATQAGGGMLGRGLALDNSERPQLDMEEEVRPRMIVTPSPKGVQSRYKHSWQSTDISALPGVYEESQAA